MTKLSPICKLYYKKEVDRNEESFVTYLRGKKIKELLREKAH